MKGTLKTYKEKLPTPGLFASFRRRTEQVKWNVLRKWKPSKRAGARQAKQK